VRGDLARSLSRGKGGKKHKIGGKVSFVKGGGGNSGNMMLIHLDTVAFTLINFLLPKKGKGRREKKGGGRTEGLRAPLEGEGPQERASPPSKRKGLFLKKLRPRSRRQKGVFSPLSSSLRREGGEEKEKPRKEKGKERV